MADSSQLVPVDQVLEQVLATVSPVAEEQSVSLNDARGRILARDITSPINVPPADNSAMDGYALNTEDDAVHEGASLEVSDRIPAGHVGGPLQAGTLVRIFTGAEVPPGANAVVMQENTEEVDGKIRINVMPRERQNIRPMGQDIAEGDVILRRGRRLQPQDLGLIASVGVADCTVFRKLKVAIMSTGDELVQPPGPAKPGQIFNSNHFVLAGLIKDLGMDVVDLGIVRDTAEATETALSRGAAEADCILSSGGVSVGEEDYVKAAVEKLGAIDIWRIAIKPGKPLAFGAVDGTPFFGLPGNPVSSFVTFLIVARPYLLKYQGCADVANPWFCGVADFEQDGGSRREYIRVRFRREDDRVHVVKYDNQGSGVMSSVCWADGLAEIDIDQTVRPGGNIKVFPL